MNKGLEGWAWRQVLHTRLIGAALLLCVLGLLSASFGAARTVRADGNSLAATQTPTTTGQAPGPGSGLPGVSTTATVLPVEVNGPAGWEVAALRDLAEVRDWPPFVNRDASGRLTVQEGDANSELSLALIRPFDYRAGASAAFTAEQEDARLAGMIVSSESFYSYPAYWAVSYDSQGQAIEMRFHWLANTWIMGAELRRSGARTGDVRLIGQQLLALAIQYGLPAPPYGTTPTPTVLLPSTPIATRTPTACTLNFEDVATGYWARSYIMELACGGIVSGYGDGTFRPQNSTTRGQLAKMLVLSEGWTIITPGAPEQPTFNDVSQGHTFYRFIETAYARGIISGYADGTFRPDDFVTRAQVAKMIVRGRGWPMRVSSPVTLCDVSSGHWASAFIQVAIDRGIFTGYGDGCFQPDAFATRAQLAKVLTLAHR